MRRRREMERNERRMTDCGGGEQIGEIVREPK